MRSFPLLLIAVIIYNLIAFGSGLAGQHDVEGLLSWNTSIAMFSGDIWKISGSDLLLLLALALLFMEIIKATRAGAREIANHALSMLTFVIALVEFIVLKGFSTTVFFFILLMTLFDVIAGYTISILAAKRDMSVHRIEEEP